MSCLLGLRHACAEPGHVGSGCHTIPMYRCPRTRSVDGSIAPQTMTSRDCHFRHAVKLSRPSSPSRRSFDPIMAYRPPHRRDLPAPPPTHAARLQPGSASQSRIPANERQRNDGTRVPRPPQSRRDWATPPMNSLRSPPGDIRPMRRTQEVTRDEMDMVQSISRSGGDGAEGDA